MNNFRNKIDELDNIIMNALEERFKLSKEIGLFKHQNEIKLTVKTREDEILAKSDEFIYDEEIKNIYQEIFKQSKKIQKTKYALIGKSLPYSLSPWIYKKLGLENYELIETNDFLKTIKKRPFLGLNITNPYKKEAFAFCSFHDESSKLTGVANVIFHHKAYNSDYLALVDILKETKIDFTNLKIIIIGNGATALSVSSAIGGKQVFLVRTIRGENEDLIANYKKYLAANVIINATPYGTYPQIEESPLFSLAEFNNLVLVMDLVYNPLNTPLLKEAKRKNILTINGLNLLIRQAYLNYNIFKEKKLTYSPQYYYHKLTIEHLNIVLIGMPYAGKSTIGLELAPLLNKELIDFDTVLAQEEHDLARIIESEGLAAFRKYELDLAKNMVNQFSKVIVPGGGIVLSPEAMHYLSLNALIVFINPSIKTLQARLDYSRPLIKSIDDLEKTYNSRLHLYRYYCDLEINEEKEITKIIYEYIYNKWS